MADNRGTLNDRMLWSGIGSTVSGHADADGKFVPLDQCVERGLMTQERYEELVAWNNRDIEEDIREIEKESERVRTLRKQRELAAQSNE